MHELKGFSIVEFERELAEARIPQFRAMQILSWVYDKNVSSFEEMTNIPKSMREQLSETFPLFNPSIVSKLESVDGSRKYLVEFHDGCFVETVGLPSRDGRLTVCVSSQSGCAMNCAFCATGKAGFSRNLLPGEIVDQVLMVQDDYSKRVTNVVIMGQGEPFANYDNTLAALKILNHPKLLGLGSRHITVSTCGIIEGIERFSQEPEQFTLAISLHSARQEVRDMIMPAMANQRLGSLRKQLASYSERTGRRFSFEYALMDSINDSEEDLRALIKYCQRLLCHVNLIPLNDVESSSFKPSPMSTMTYWNEELEKAGIASSMRKSRGRDIDAACGQLALRYK